ncbi:hypothetical protein BLA60_28190 [Actinophytocola xinjiangensis]|uniref:Uncharacterized protein n=1 Tax=Actinophytocola xinjiangensis TaxID=485602 RepID=A0A7Z0WHZ0_9PSEU|nr:hypothetical protein [Actinophytocola xinjiangensis]OLF07103.1 hypothetical protein BLA60_28190 [Actinophytocola xinjiangensis]
MTAPQAAAPLVAPPPTEPAALHRPWRALVAVVELALAGGLVFAAFWAWPRGFSTILTVTSEGREVVADRIHGNWLATAIGFGALGALLVVDAVRQAALAVRTRPRQAKRSTKVARED